MKHTDLLAYIKHYGQLDQSSNTWALVSVVKLHEAVGRGYQIEKNQVGYGEGLCSNCGWSYPCPTIQAIEKELM